MQLDEINKILFLQNLLIFKIEGASIEPAK